MTLISQHHRMGWAVVSVATCYAVSGQLPQNPPAAIHPLQSFSPSHVLTTDSAECRESKQCAPAKHHFDDCVERVTNAEGDQSGEDCVEECKFRPGFLAVLFATVLPRLTAPDPTSLHNIWFANMARFSAVQSSTSPTAPPSAPPPSSGLPSNRRSL